MAKRIDSNTLRGYQVWLPLRIEAGHQFGGRFTGPMFPANNAGRAAAIALAEQKDGKVKQVWGYLRDPSYSDLDS